MNENDLNKLRQLELIKEIILKKILTREARERLSRVKLVKPELAAQVELYLVQLYQAGRLKGTISDQQLKSILSSLA